MTVPTRWPQNAVWGTLLALAFALPLAAAAQTRPAPAASNRQPIEISADALEVQQDKRLAIFAGNVAATQGAYLLRADRMAVSYAATGGDNSISKIDATGKVFFSTPAETAQGDAGTYDVDAGIITLTGAVFLGLVAVLPLVVQGFTGITTLTIGGTALLIVVSVVLETMKQLESQLTLREYEGFLS